MAGEIGESLYEGEPDWLKKNVLKPKCFGKNKNKTPRHPLYLSYNTNLEDYR